MLGQSRTRSRILKALKCSSNDLKNRFPISKWITSYNLEKLRGDVISGLAVGLMVVPQSLAIASLAGLAPQHGLYSSFPGVFVYCLLGTSKDMSVGPTVLAALMADRYNPSQSPQVASMLAFIAGIVLMLIGLLKLSFVVQFISLPVFSGFISAAAIAISVSQLKDLLGLAKAPRSFFLRLEHLFGNVQNTRLGDAVLGISCLVFLISLHVIGQRTAIPARNSSFGFGRKLFGFVNVAKSALVAIVATTVAYLFHVAGYRDVFILAGELPEGLPSLQVPLKPLRISSNETMDASDVILSFGSGLGLVPLIMFIESIAVAKALACKNKYKIDASQELIAVGISNIFASFFAALPITGSFGRSAVNSVSGAATPVSGIFCGIIVILALAFITPVFKFIPMAALAAMVIAAVLTMIEFKLPRKLWLTNRADLLPFAASFFGCFYELEVGIMSGALVSLVLILYRVLRPRVAIVTTDSEPCVVTLRIKGGLWFPGTEHIANKLQEIVSGCVNKERLDYDKLLIIIDCQSMFEIDYTVAMGLKTLLTDLRMEGFRVEFKNVESIHVKSVLEKTGLIQSPRQIEELSAAEEQVILYESNV